MDEPITNERWELTIDLPKDLQMDSTNQVIFADGLVTMDKIEFSELSTKLLCKKIQNDIDNIKIEFNCNIIDDSVHKWMNSWLEAVNKKDINRLMTYFDFCQDEQHPNGIAMVLKTPINKLTEEEKKEIRDMLAEMTDIDVKKLNEIIK